MSGIGCGLKRLALRFIDRHGAAVFLFPARVGPATAVLSSDSMSQGAFRWNYCRWPRRLQNKLKAYQTVEHSGKAFGSNCSYPYAKELLLEQVKSLNFGRLKLLTCRVMESAGWH